MLYNMFHRMCARQSIGLEVRHHLGAGVDVNFGIDRSRAVASCVVAVLAVLLLASATFAVLAVAALVAAAAAAVVVPKHDGLSDARDLVLRHGILVRHGAEAVGVFAPVGAIRVRADMAAAACSWGWHGAVMRLVLMGTGFVVS